MRSVSKGDPINILLITLLYPVPANEARGVFVHEHAQLLAQLGHEVKVINPLPRMPRYAEARRSTLTGVSRAPSKENIGGIEVYRPRFFALPEHPYPRLTRWSVQRKAKRTRTFLGEWKPDVILCHTLWPVGHLAKALATHYSIPWASIVHGYDVDVGLEKKETASEIRSLLMASSVVIGVTQRLTQRIESVVGPLNRALTIPCHTEIGNDWRREMKPWKGRWQRDSLDVLFPADPRRSEKNYVLALRVGEELEQRGWKVGMTTLQHVPKDMALDRMLVADVTLITSIREAAPLVARESLLCGTPVVSVDVGEVRKYLPEDWIRTPTPPDLADGIECALRNGWQHAQSPAELMHFCSEEVVKQSWSELLSTLEV